ncbi:MAG: Gldg family protein [Proteobacteria bacterium]|nr:Gldg family protein [Pseudomonadota bacterium]
MADKTAKWRTGGRESLGLASLLVALVLFVAVNILSQAWLKGARLDLTGDKLFTVTEGTRSILAKIDEPLTLRFYFSASLGKELPGLAKYAARVRDLLGEYAALAGGKIRLQIADPSPFSDDEDTAVAFGIQGIPLDQTGEMVYFGLAGTNSTDDEETITFFSPARERFLEYDLTKLIHNLANPKRTVIGLMTSLPVRGYPGTALARMGRGRPWQMVDQLQQLFDVQTVDTNTDEIDKEIDVLMIVHPAGFSEKTLYAVDQFLMNGGRALIFTDPLAEIAGRVPAPGGGRLALASDFKRLFDAWGIEQAPGVAVGDRLLARRVDAGTAQRSQPVDFLPWITLKPENFAAGDVITNEIESMNLASAGSLKPKAGATTKFTPLITTSPEAMLIDTEKLKNRPDFFGLIRDFKPAGVPYTLAARISGPAPSAFPDGPPTEEASKQDGDGGDAKEAAPKVEGKEKDDAAKKPPHLSKSKSDINIIVVADADMLRDQFWVELQQFFGQVIAIPIANNIDFVINALDNLAGSDELIGLRSRGVSQRPFERVVDLTRAAEIRYRATERELQTRREQTEEKLSDLQRPGQAGGGKIILTPAQIEEIDKFKGELLKIRKQLRQVQLDLRREIEALEARLQFYNIALIPIGVAALAIILGLLRIRRRRQRTETEALG